MNHSIPHDLDQATAKRVVDKAFEDYKKRFAEYDPTMRWARDDRAEIGFNAKGIRLSGAMTVAARAIDLDLDVPFLLRPFRGKAIEVIEDEVKKWIAKAKAGEI
jgi:hypothetical protein